MILVNSGAFLNISSWFCELTELIFVMIPYISSTGCPPTRKGLWDMWKWRITCTLCKKLYIGETGRRLGDRFREHLRDVEKDDKNASKPVARHFNLPNHSMQHMAVCGLSLHQGNTESRKTLEQKFIFQIRAAEEKQNGFCHYI